MTDKTKIPHGLADLPLEERRRIEVEWQRELNEGLTRAHLQGANFRAAYLAHELGRAIALAATLRGE